MLLIEADTGKVLHAENSTQPWYPASVTKLMTAYVTLARGEGAPAHARHAAHRLAAMRRRRRPPRWAFSAGTTVTVDNALKMLMVKSANDVAVVLAEGVSGSIEKFADDMNRAAARLGMTQTTYVNPNGLPADAQITSARDQAILARAIIRRIAGIRIVLAHFRDQVRQARDAQLQHADRPLSRRRRHEDRLHLRLRLQSRGVGDAQRQAADRGRARRAFRRGARGEGRADAGARLQQSAAFSWLTPSLGNVEGLVADQGRAAESARRHVRQETQASGRRIRRRG